jgi:hypothetical protein
MRRESFKDERGRRKDEEDHSVFHSPAFILSEKSLELSQPPTFANGNGA